MKYRTTAILAIITILAAFVVSGCGKNTLATVNGDKITKDQYYKRLEMMAVGNPPRPAGLLVLDQMMNETLVLQMAKEKGVYPTDEQIQKKINFAKREGNLDQTLRQRGISLEDYKKELLPTQAQINIITKGIKVTDAEIKQGYEENKEKVFTKPERTLISVVICKTKDAIMKAKAQLDKNVDFAAVALSLSEDPTKDRGGEVDWIWRGMPNVPPMLVDKAFALKVNQYSEPFEIPQYKQWVIVKATDRRPKMVFGLDEMKDQIRESMAMSKAQQEVNFTQIVQKERAKSKVEIKADRYKQLGEAWKQASDKNEK